MAVRKQAGKRLDSAPTDEQRRYSSCRALGHTWRHLPGQPDGGGVLFMSACEFCGTERSKWITRSGEYRSSYRYAEGYSQHGNSKLNTVEWRRVLITTAIG